MFRRPRNKTHETVSIFMLIGTVIGVAIIASPLRAWAQAENPADDPWADVEEMVVTGGGATDLLSDIAGSNSVTAFKAEDLEAIGAADISDIAAFTPNLEIVTAGATSPTFFIRGIGLNDFNANAAGAVAIYQDGVALNSPALQLGSLFDIESTNVLRGPQGTGGYRNASAGAIKVYSRRPSGDFGASIRTEFGNYDLVDIEGALEFPIVMDRLSARFSFRTSQRDGVMTNRCAGAPPFSDRTRRPGGGSPTNPLWSICGESVSPNDISQVDPGQPKNINDRDSWAVRGVLLFEPDLAADVDMDWMLTGRAAKVDQLSTVGQSIGVVGTQRFPDTGAPSINGLLGGPDAGGYRDQDVIDRRRLLVANATAFCQPSCTGPQRQLANASVDRALASELARDLDRDPFTGAFSRSGPTTNDTLGFSLNGNMTFGEITLSSVSGWDSWNRLVDVDLDFSPNELFQVRTRDDGWQFFQALELSGDLDGPGSGLISWKLGVFGLYEDLEVKVDNDFGDTGLVSGAPSAREYTQTVTSVAGYVDLSWELSEEFTLDGGVRYNYDEREIDYELFRVGPPLVQDGKLESQEPTGTVRLTYNPTVDISAYLKYTRGWKSGTFNATGNNRVGVSSAKPEVIDSFELGANASFWEGRIDVLAAIFHYSYQNYQLFTSQSGFQAPPEFVILNASDVELYGAELEVDLKPWEGAGFGLKLAWLEGEFLDFTQTQLIDVQVGNDSIVIPQEINNSGNRLLNAPRYTVTLSAQQAFPVADFGALILRWDGTWKDTTYFDATEGRGIPNSDGVQILPKNTIGQRAYWLHNFRIAFRTLDEHLEVAAWVRNATNTGFKTFAADLTTFQSTTLYFVGDPRTYGGTVSLRF